jgi:hypothetical protein
VLNRSSFNVCRITSLAFKVAIALWPYGAGAISAEESKPSVPASAVPTIEALPHIALPRGTFKTWCGRNDRFLLAVDGQLEAYDAERKAATIAVSSSWPVQCSLDGRQLIYTDTNMKHFMRVDIASGDSRLLASFSGQAVLSPDFQNVAVAGTLEPAPDAGNIKIVHLPGSDDSGPLGNVSAIVWSEDSSKLFFAYFRGLEVYDANGAKIGSGRFPKETYYRDGWFEAGQQTLVLLLARDEDESGPGRLIRCRIVDWKCERIKPLTDVFSVGGRGILGTVSPFGKPPKPGPDDDGGTVLLYSKYAGELRGHASKLLARQIFATATGRSQFGLYVSPSGIKAILTWSVRTSATCKRSDDSEFYCPQSILIDLSKLQVSK